MKLNLTTSSSYRERHFNKKPRRRAAERAVGHPIPSSCESRFPRLRNVRVAGVQFLILVTVQGSGGAGFKLPSLQDGIAAWPAPVQFARRQHTSMG